MKKIQTLTKLHRNRVEEALKEITRLKGAKELMQDKMSNIIKSMNDEAANFSSTEYGFVLDRYLNGSREACERLQDNIDATDRKIHDAQEALRKEFSELKKFEIVLKDRTQAMADAEKRAETKEFDELNIITFA